LGPGGASFEDDTADGISAARSPTWRRIGPDAIGVGCTVLAAVLVLVPALRPGVSLGPFDVLSRLALTARPGVTVHNAMQSDQILFFVPMTNAAWQQVHNGHLPLWNPYNVLGTPLAFNWESGVFSLPMLLGYLAPVGFAYTVVVLAKLVIAGTGAYVFGRVLGLRPLSATTGAVAFELSGTMLHYSGWSLTGVTCWYGWVFAAAMLTVSSRRRVLGMCMLPVSVAFAIYGGYPAGLAILAGALAVFVVLHLATGLRSGGARAGPALVRLAGGVLLGASLGAPLLLPGVQLGLESARRYAPGNTQSYPLSHLPDLLASGLQGANFKTSAYLGVVAVALAVVGAASLRRRRDALALAVIAVLAGLLTYVSAADRLAHLLPGGRDVNWDQAVSAMTFALAILCAIGVEHLLDPETSARARDVALGAFAGCGLVVGLVELAIAIGANGVGSYQSSLIWPAAQAVAGVALLALLRPRNPRRLRAGVGVDGRSVAALLFSVQAAFLITSGVSFWSLSSSFFSPTAEVSTLQRSLGDNTVGLGLCTGLGSVQPFAQEVGIRADANIGYGVKEMAVYDPILPEAYYRAWFSISGQRTPVELSRLGIFCPSIGTVAEAQALGVSYVLEPPGDRGPIGTVYERSIGPESLWFVPGSARATVSTATAGASCAAPGPAAPVPVTETSPGSWRIVVDSGAPKLLCLRLTAAPGWRATIDGRPLGLRTWEKGMMLEARAGPGRHFVALSYWPVLFSAGLLVALCSLLVLAGGSVVAAIRGRRARVETQEPEAKVSSPR
jgi:hypothetical protein